MQQATTWAKIDPDAIGHQQGHNELIKEIKCV